MLQYTSIHVIAINPAIIYIFNDTRVKISFHE